MFNINNKSTSSFQPLATGVSQHKYAKFLGKNLSKIEECVKDPGQTFEMQEVFDRSLRSLSEEQGEVLVFKTLGGKNEQGELILPKVKWEVPRKLPIEWQAGDTGTYYKDPSLISEKQSSLWIPSQEEVGALFRFIADDPNIPWDHTVDNCHVRSNYTAQILVNMKIKPENVRKLFCFGTIKNNWAFHVATFVVDSNGKEWVFDPSLFGSAVSIKEWTDEVNIHNLLSIDHKEVSEGNQSWDKSQIHTYRSAYNERWVGDINFLTKEKFGVEYCNLGNILIKKQLMAAKDYALLLRPYWPLVSGELVEFCTEQQKDHKIALQKLDFPDIIPTPEDIKNISLKTLLEEQFNKVRLLSPRLNHPDLIDSFSEKLEDISFDMKNTIEESIQKLNNCLAGASSLSENDRFKLQSEIESKRLELNNWTSAEFFEKALQSCLAFSEHMPLIKSIMLGKIV